MIGKTISHYKITEKIGQGGMGEVYLADDLKLERKVALKFLPEYLTKDKENIERFEREAKAAAALNHPNIVTIYDVIDEDGHLCIVMEYVKGKSLRDVIDEYKMGREKIIDIISQLSEGLSKAHKAGIVHRDIKPENIIIDQDARVKILDFGLAKLSTQTKLTKESTTSGTVSYMSPEQAKGEKVDYRTDIWSLGVILYEILTGQLPFKGEYESAVIYSILNDTQEPVTGLRTGVPMELERIINKCLQKNPTDRYQHIDDLIVDLRNLKKESESEIIPYKDEEEMRRHTRKMIYMFLSIFILIIIGYFLIKPGEESLSGWENSIAVLPFTDLSPEKDQEYFCDGMTDKILTNLSKLKVLKVIARTSVMKYKKTEKSIPEIGEELGVENVVEGSIFKAGNRIRVTAQLINTSSGAHLWADDYKRTLEDIFDIQDDISEKIATALLATLSPDEKKVIKTNRPSNTEADEYYMQGRYFLYNKYMGTLNKEYINTAERMLKIAIKLDPNFSDSYANLADLYNTLYNLPTDTIHTVHERDTLLKMQEAYLDTAITLNPNSNEVMNAKSFIHWAKGEIDEAFISAKRALAFNVNNDLSYSALGYFFRELGLTKLSIKCYDRAIRLNPIYPKYYYSRSLEYINLGQMKKAEVDYHKVKEIAPNFPFLPELYSYILIATKKYTEAEKQLSKVTLSDEKIRLRAYLYAGMGEKEKALNTYKEGNLILFSLLGMTKEAIAIMTNPEEMDDSRKRSIYDLLKNSPFYDNIRTTPEFQTILRIEKELYEENLAKYGDIDI